MSKPRHIDISYGRGVFFFYQGRSTHLSSCFSLRRTASYTPGRRLFPFWCFCPSPPRCPAGCSWHSGSWPSTFWDLDGLCLAGIYLHAHTDTKYPKIETVCNLKCKNILQNTVTKENFASWYRINPLGFCLNILQLFNHFILLWIWPVVPNHRAAGRYWSTCHLVTGCTDGIHNFYLTF